MTDLHGKTVEAGLKPCLQRLGGVLTIYTVPPVPLLLERATRH